MDEKRIDKMEEKLDGIAESIHKINNTMERNTESLIHHMRRTEILEQELKPIKNHVMLMNNLAKIIVFLGVLAAIYHNLK